MPKRFCACQGCPACTAPRRRPGAHGTLYDADATGTLKCPGCQAVATARRNARPASSSRGYGRAHQQLRARLIGQWQPGDPCAHCGQPMTSSLGLDLAHNDNKDGYRGLAHAYCNRADGGRQASRGK